MSRSTRKYLAAKDALRAGDPASALQLISTSASDIELREIREQKVLLAATRMEERQALVTSFKESVHRILPRDADADEYLNYADFILCLSGLMDGVAAETRRLMRDARAFRLPDLLQQLNDFALESYTAKRSADYRAISSTLRPIGSRERALDVSEHLVQESTGSTNDIMFAVARSATHLLGSHRQGVILSNDPVASRTLLAALVMQASRWNALEYIGDMVSYGEWRVREISTGEQGSVTFDIVDPRLSRARLLGLRRHVINRQFLETQRRPIAEMLTPPLREIFRAAVQYFMDLDELTLLPTSTAAEIESAIDVLLADLSIDDELLLVAAGDDQRILADYLAELTFRSVLLASRIASGPLMNGKPTSAVCEIPIDFIESIHVKDGELDRDYREALIRRLATSRLQGWGALLERPFVDVQGRIMGFYSLLSATWTAPLRSAWGDGGTTGRKFGDLWEDYIAQLFEHHGWECAGRGVTIRGADEQMRTDADLIVVKDDVCLVVQVKGITRSGFNTYENWKARKTIVKGGQQAVAAVQRLREDAAFRISVLGKRRSRQIRQVHGLVVTNAIVFSGWRSDDIPVLGVGSLTSILRGAEVIVTRKDGASQVTETAMPRQNLTASDTLKYFDAPVEWTLASDSETVDHQWRSEFGVRFALPYLRRA